MLNIKERPYRLLLFTAIALSFALVFPPIAHIDFQDKTMFSVPLVIIAWIIPLLLISFWLLYLLTKRFLYSIAITWIHVLITVSATILMVIFLYIGINPLQLASHSYYDISLMERQELIGNAMQILFILFICGQFTFLANVLSGLFTKNK